MRNIIDSEYTAKLNEESCTVDLFGDPIELVKTRGKRHKEVPLVTVSFKMKWDEYKELCKMAQRFGMSKSRYARDAVRESLKNHNDYL